MFFCNIFLVVSMLSFLRDFYVTSCNEICSDQPVFTPPRLVVKFGDPSSVICSVCQRECQDRTSGLEINVGGKTKNGTTITWTVERVNLWDTSAICFYKHVSGKQCCSKLNVTVYQPPDNVSISFLNHTGPMFKGQQYTVQCTVQNVAPVKNLIVTFYKGQTALGHPQSKNNVEKKPVTEIFTSNITPSEEDDGVQYWCEAKLDLGPEGPQLPPVVKSQNITATVYYKPQLEGSSHFDPIVIREGSPLQLNCSAVGNPTPLYTWKLPMASTSPSNGSVLIIKSVTSADGGLYTCSVSNNVGTVTVNFSIVVQGPEMTSTRLPPTTTTAQTTTSTFSTTITQPAQTSVTPSTTKATSTTTSHNSSTSSALIHRITLCLVLLFCALV